MISNKKSILSSLLWEWWGAGTGCPQRLWMLHPWRCSRPGWMGPWAAWSSIRYGGLRPFLWEWGWNLMILEAPSNPSHSMILWFYDKRGKCYSSPFLPCCSTMVFSWENPEHLVRAKADGWHHCLYPTTTQHCSVKEKQICVHLKPI